MYLADLYQNCRKELKDGGAETPDLDIRLILKEALGINDADIISGRDIEVLESEVNRIKSWVDRRVSGEPVSKIIGKREFWGLPFIVNENVLDPRPDTETLVEAALKRFSDNPPGNILDIGTGSGCILISLLSEWPDAVGTAVDISEKALETAEKNAELNKVQNRCRFVNSNLSEAISGQKFDLIVSNPPYIPNREIDSLANEVKNHDPILALDGGDDGLYFIKKIINELSCLLKSRGICFLEVGFGQAENVVRLVEETGLSIKGLHSDLAGTERVVEISCGDK
jgi:release factor glutamine methyltransferase